MEQTFVTFSQCTKKKNKIILVRFKFCRLRFVTYYFCVCAYINY